MKAIAACDGRDLAPFLDTLARLLPLQDAEVLFAHVIDESFEAGWQQVAGHHWPGWRPETRAHAHFQETASRSAGEILEEAMSLSREWPAAVRRPVELYGNPERELVRLAMVEHAAVLAVGQHRLELGPHALGHCARFVVDHAPCPVLLVRDESFHAAAAALLGHKLKEKAPHGPERKH